MPNVLYDTGAEGLLDGSIDLTGDVRAALVRSTYAPDLETDATLADLGGGNIVGRSGPLTGKTFTGGVFDADDAELTAAFALPCAHVVLFQHTGDDSTARLIVLINQPASGLPFTPGAGQIIDLIWDNGPDRIFTIKRAP